MADDKKFAPETDSMMSEATGDTARRQFLKRAGQVAVTTQAVTLLLAAGGKPSLAGANASGADGGAKLKKDQAVDGPDGDGDCGGGSDSGVDQTCN